ncbi:hypothetical protein HNR60_003289 [Rhodopseudomonas rhenobacensis]|uniref:MORN repeat variant n=1 Tax=Rhodopseudomonas rhenobacensis TaxID=87461 RepID=A0A7W7Z6Q7_9BRAD|nr:hypothetical protein [Rhodopseudomonas rhenobacensis]MBB5048522.1 hypothetical protein [Rhodopseudomonas rhenobacensis]
MTTHSLRPPNVDETLYADLVAMTAKMAQEKNVQLTDTIGAQAVCNVAVESLGPQALQRVRKNDPAATILAAKAIDRALDLCAATDVMLLMNAKAGVGFGYWNNDQYRIEAFVGCPPANDEGQRRHRWPARLADIVERYDAARWSRPICITLPQGRARTSYFLDRAALQSGIAAAPSWPHLWRLIPPDAMIPTSRRDTAYGPVIETLNDGTVITSYWYNGMLHRDPTEGPAWRLKGAGRERSEYRVDGRLHRPHAEGPAVIDRDAARGIAAEHYYADGELHRPASEGPAQIETNAEGERVLEAYIERGRMHRDPGVGPALYRRDFVAQRWEYYVDGQQHRPSGEGPAVTHIDLSGRLVHEVYMEYGFYHREASEGPAYYTRDGGKEHWTYAENGWWHRDENAGPAFITRDAATGCVLRDEYYFCGKAHRSHGPAAIEYAENGAMLLQSWFCEGWCHRDPVEGAAVIRHDVEGRIIERQYWIEGMQVPPLKRVRAVVAQGDTVDTRKEAVTRTMGDTMRASPVGDGEPAHG